MRNPDRAPAGLMMRMLACTSQQLRIKGAVSAGNGQAILAGREDFARCTTALALLCNQLRGQYF